LPKNHYLFPRLFHFWHTLLIMGNLLPLRIESLNASTLDFDSMTLAPPSTMELVKSQGSAYCTTLPWPTYILDAWYSPEIQRYMLARPIGRVQLDPGDIADLKAKTITDSLLQRVKSQMTFPFSNLTHRNIEHVINMPPRKGPPAYFVRTSMCSTKIGSHPNPATSASQVLSQITESQRCLAALSEPVQHNIWLFEWTDADITREFRVFIKNRKVVAIAPYYCAVPLEWLASPETASAVSSSILKFYDKIAPHVHFEDAVMDVLYTEDGEIKLIEFNPMETSGGGLFSWVTDSDLLAGKHMRPLMRYVIDDY